MQTQHPQLTNWSVRKKKKARKRKKVDKKDYFPALAAITSNDEENTLQAFILPGQAYTHPFSLLTPYCTRLDDLTQNPG